MRRSYRLLAILSCAFAAGATSAQPESPVTPLILRVHVADRAADIPRLAAMQLDLAGIDVKRDTVDFVGDKETFQVLLERGFFPEIVVGGLEGTEALSQYLDPQEVSDKLDSYLPVESGGEPLLAKKVAISVTGQGRIEWALKISDNVNAEEDEPVVLFVGQHHAREVMTPEIAFDIIDYLVTRYATDPQVRAWVDEREIWVVPSHNPDGANTVFTSSSGWRKNRRVNGDGSFGVDPNRNYPMFWGFCSSGGGASSAPSSDTYRGPSAASEPETQGIMQLARDQRPVLSISYHTYSELVIHPYGCADVTGSEQRMFRDHSSDMAARLRNDSNDGWYSNGTPWELLYEVSGGFDEWLYSELGIVATTIEANSGTQGFQPAYDTWRNQTVQRNRPGWQYVLDRVDGPSIWGHTADACTGAPLSATLGLDEVVFNVGETPRTSDPTFGRFQHLTVPGSYHLRASKSGYTTQVWPVEVGFEAVRKEVRLVPTGSFALAVRDFTVTDPDGDLDGAIDPGETATLIVTAIATGESVSGVTGVLSTSDPYVTILDPDGQWPAIAAGGSAASSDGFAFSVSPATPDGHTIDFDLAFSADQSLCLATAGFEARVDTHVPVCPAISQRLDANPGWTIQNNDATGWAFGNPASGGVGGPSVAHTGASVYGTNLNGNYSDGADDRLITTPFDLSGIRNAQLRFWRWLNNEAGYDLASVDVSTDGVAFTNLWSGFGRDVGWESYRYDISSVADGQPTVYVRFRLQSDGSTVGAGFYIDDVSICGDAAVPPPPRLTVVSFRADDAGDASCTDHDAFADAGESVDLTVEVRNDGFLPASGAVATLSSSDSRIGLASFRASLGTIASGATAAAPFRITIPSGIACGSSLPLRVDVESNDGSISTFDASLLLTANTDAGVAVLDLLETFESPSGWSLMGEWEIALPRGKGGTANNGSGSPDPTVAVSGAKVLGFDLSGQLNQVGNYENGLTIPIIATSPVWNCSAATSVQLQFHRWLGVEQFIYDKATIEAWNGSAWQPVWQNPSFNLSDSAWQLVSYDVTPWAAGNPQFQVRFKQTTDAGVVYCGWNIDDLRITSGPPPPHCEDSPCASGCTPAAPIEDLTLSKSDGNIVAEWMFGADPCQAASGANYRVYRSADPGPRNEPAVQWPQDSYFMDVTARDLDGTAANSSFVEAELPPSGVVFYYLVVPMGTSGLEGPSGWAGF